MPPTVNTKRRGDSFFSRIEALLAALRRDEEGGAEAVAIRESLLVEMPELKGCFMYPWHVLLVALVSDALRRLTTNNNYFFRMSVDDVSSVLFRARHADRIFGAETPKEPLGRPVGDFVVEARRAFEQTCWHIIDPDIHDSLSREDRRLLMSLLRDIPEDDRNRESCEAIYHGLCSALASGMGDPSGILEEIMRIELEDEWDSGLED